ALEGAGAYLRRAVRGLPAPAARSPLLLALARARHGLGDVTALDHVLEAYDAAHDPTARAQAATALQWASGPGRQDPLQALAMIERALAEVGDRELELRLHAVRCMAAFLDMAQLSHLLAGVERFADLPGDTQGECELLLHVAV